MRGADAIAWDHERRKGRKVEKGEGCLSKGQDISRGQQRPKKVSHSNFFSGFASHAKQNLLYTASFAGRSPHSLT